jgi:hypothetical protein
VTLRNRLWLVRGRLITLFLVGALIPASVHAGDPAVPFARATGTERPPVPHGRIMLDPASVDESIARLVTQPVEPLAHGRVDRVTRSNVAVQGSRRSAVPWGILGGSVVGIAVSGSAAARYGDNEGGDFCTPCFVRWSSVTIPVGAAVGALTGYLIDVARR